MCYNIHGKIKKGVEMKKAQGNKTKKAAVKEQDSRKCENCYDCHRPGCPAHMIPLENRGVCEFYS